VGFKDFRKRLSSSTDEIDQVRLQDRFCDVDCSKIEAATPRTRVVISGEVQAIQVVPRAGSSWLEVTVGDGTGKAVAVFTGRRRIGGLEPGRAVLLEGVAGTARGRLQLMNPAYTLLG
jgi:RecG-like helicase